MCIFAIESHVHAQTHPPTRVDRHCPSQVDKLTLIRSALYLSTEALPFQPVPSLPAVAPGEDACSISCFVATT